MRKLLVRSLLILAVFASASRARAAAIEIVISQTSPTEWRLVLANNSTSSIGSLTFLVSDTLASFTIVDPRVQLPLIPPLCGIPGYVCFTPELSPPVPPFDPPALLGYFTTSSPDAIVSVLAGEEYFGATAFDANDNPLFDVALRLVPEPGVSGLALLALLPVTLRLTRRVKGAQRAAE